ncbi:hypothetical protein BH11MYX1_BH11MYX1_29950 [soil metagenome]
MNPLRCAVVVMAVVAGLATARADSKADRAAIVDRLTRMSASATTLGKAAKASDDRGARKKFAPAATELGDDLAALARRAAKDVPLKTIAKDAAPLEKDAAALVELADEAEDKDERKSLRATAVVIHDAVVEVRKSLDASAAKAEDAPAAAAKFTGRLLNNSDSCSWAENEKFVISANGQQVVTTQLVFPGKDLSVVLYKGSYLVQVTDTVGKVLAQGTLVADREGWMFRSGCVNQD